MCVCVCVCVGGGTFADGNDLGICDFLGRQAEPVGWSTQDTGLLSTSICHVSKREIERCEIDNENWKDSEKKNIPDLASFIPESPASFPHSPLSTSKKKAR